MENCHLYARSETWAAAWTAAPALLMSDEDEVAEDVVG
jgi:hypothetical protein